MLSVEEELHDFLLSEDFLNDDTGSTIFTGLLSFLTFLYCQWTLMTCLMSFSTKFQLNIPRIIILPGYSTFFISAPLFDSFYSLFCVYQLLLAALNLLQLSINTATLLENP